MIIPEKSPIVFFLDRVRRRMFTGIDSRIVPDSLLTIIVVSLICLVGTKVAYCQAVPPPPGFEPAIDGATASPTPQTIFTGTDTTSPFDQSNSLGSPTQTFDSTKSSVNHAYPNRGRVFREPSSRILIEDEEPAMPRIWFRLEALYWWTKDVPVSAPLVTVGNPADTVPGALGQPGTAVVLGNEAIGLSGRDGARFTVGFTFDAAQEWGLEGTFFGLSSNSSTIGVSSNGHKGSSLLSFPFFDPTLPGENAAPLSSPGHFSGDAWLSVRNRLQGTEINLLHNRYHSDGMRLDVIGGFRYVNFRESLEFDTDSPDIAPPFYYFNTYDYIRANNNFYGAQIGLRGSIDRGRFFANAATKLAVGDMFENVYVEGGTFTNIGGFASGNGGYFTGPTNDGSHTRSQFAFVPELDLNIGFRIRPWCSVSVGYSLLYLSSVARPGDQIDRNINPANAPAMSGNFSGIPSTPATPGVGIHSTDFWAQGLNFSLDFRF